jgi:arylsulfatase A-like enzyme
VPVIFLGPGVPAGRRDGAATPADIAPTLAALAGFSFTTPDGRVLIGRAGDVK